jgi:excinuclease ABC subunit B
VLDADKEGFLRSATSLIQTCGRAARNAEGRVIFYAERRTDSIESTLAVVERRREKQALYTQAHGIVPRTIITPVRDSIEALYEMDYTGPALEDEREDAGVPVEAAWDADALRGELAKLREEMLHAATELRFEDAARLRDRIKKLEKLELAR